VAARSALTVFVKLATLLKIDLLPKKNMNKPIEKSADSPQSLREKVEALSTDKKVQLAILLKLKESALRNQVPSKQ
jgi:hypothetical protein